MVLISLKEVSLKFGEQIIFDNINFELKKSQKICLLGRNGSGKSTLFKTVMGQIHPDSGSVTCKPNLKIRLLNQDLPNDSDFFVKDYLATGLKDHIALINEYNKKNPLLAMRYNQILLRQPSGCPFISRIIYLT